MFCKRLRDTILFMISEKDFTSPMFLQRGAHMHQKSQQDIKFVFHNFQFFQPINYLHVD